jgi:hypothetical protein
MPKYKIKVTLPASMGQLLEKMARKREMPLDTLVSELVSLGIHSLGYPPPQVPDGILRGIDPSEDNF